MSNNFIQILSKKLVPDSFFAYVASLLHFDSVNNGVFTDVKGNTVGSTGQTLSTTVKSKGDGSAYFNSKGGITVTNNNNQLVIGTQDFTFEFDVYLTTLGSAQMLMDQRGYHQTGNYLCMYMRAGGGLDIYLQEQIRISSNGPLALGWNTIALSRANGVLQLFVGGVLQGSYNDSTNLLQAMFQLGANGWYGLTVDLLSGYMDEVRLTIGKGRYTANYIPSAEPFADQ